MFFNLNVLTVFFAIPGSMHPGIAKVSVIFCSWVLERVSGTYAIPGCMLPAMLQPIFFSLT